MAEWRLGKCRRRTGEDIGKKSDIVISFTSPGTGLQIGGTAR